MNNWIKNLIAPVIAAVLAAGAANGAFWEWSKTPSSNATADPTINWSEGMSPSSVNDSARAMMARIADYRDDVSGSIATGGSSTAYTVTTNQGFDATPVTGQLLAFTPHATNGANATLAADGGTAFAIQSAPGTAVAAATLISGTPYTVKFNGTAWILRNFYGNPYIVPLGAVLDYTGTSAPNSNFVMANGQCISRTTYASYFALVGTTFSTCDGTTTFGVPDLRGRVVAGTNTLGTSSANRITSGGGNFDGDTLGNAGGAQNQTLTLSQLPSTNLSINNITVNNGTNVVHTTGTFTESAAGNDRASLDRSATNTKSDITLSGNIPLGGSGNSHPNVQPTMVLSKIVRIF